MFFFYRNYQIQANKYINTKKAHILFHLSLNYSLKSIVFNLF